MFTSIFGCGSGSGTLELRIRIGQKFRIFADPDPQHWVPALKYRYSSHTTVPFEKEQHNIIMVADSFQLNSRESRKHEISGVGSQLSPSELREKAANTAAAISQV
jgi:hypothetical protein